MLRTKELQDKLLHLVGWQQGFYEASVKVNENLMQSESGLYFQQVHPLLTLENLAAIAPDFSQDDADAFSNWLELKTRASIQKAVSRYYNEKVAGKVSSILCENKVLFDGAGRLADTIKNQGKIVGFELVPLRTKGVVTKINRIGLQFTEPGEYIIYLFHSSQLAPIKQVKLTKTKKNSLEWFSLEDWLLPYAGANDAGGSWYICYLQTELPENSKAISKSRDWSKGPCKGCAPSEFASWQLWSKYLEVHPFTVPDAEYRDTLRSLWDISEMDYHYNTNYGLNLDITVGCDITDFIIEQRNLFQEVISLQLAVDMLREFAFNPNVRTNRHSINVSRVDVLYELDGDSSSLKRSGLNYQLDLAFKALSVATEGLDKVCLACKNNGVKYRTI